MDSTRSDLIHLIEQGSIPADKIDGALEAVNFYPDASDWRVFIDRALLYLGTLGLSFFLLFFIAYNWTEFGRFSKFALVQVFMVAAIAVSVKYSKSKYIAEAALLASVVALGVLLALFGQTYQTGADPWQLFAVWALLMLPWAFIAQSAVIWLIWIVLLNTALFLYLKVFGGFFWSEYRLTLWCHLALNSIAWLGWELLSLRFHFLSKRWAVSLLAVTCGVFITWLVVLTIFEAGSSIHATVVWIVWLIWLSVIYWIYRHRHIDLFMLSVGCLSGVVVITVASARFLFEASRAASGFFLLAVIVVILGATAATWLSKVNREIGS